MKEIVFLISSLLERVCLSCITILASAFLFAWLARAVGKDLTKLFRLGLLSIMVIAGGLILGTIHGSTKSDSLSHAEMTRLIETASLWPLSFSDSLDDGVPQEVDDLCFTSIRSSDESVLVGLAWPETMRFDRDWIFVLASSRIDNPQWVGVAAIDMSGSPSHVVVEIPKSRLPSGSSCFLRLVANAASDASGTDSDEDGLSDAQEELYGLDPKSEDSDGDGLADADELRQGTDPLNPDSDGDRVSDGDEALRGTDPLASDSDGDGVSDFDEWLAGTDPVVGDTDDDGFTDADELQVGTDLSYDLNRYATTSSDLRIDMGSGGENVFIRPNGWPIRSVWRERWLHSDMKTIPYYYNFELYDAVVEKGLLK